MKRALSSLEVTDEQDIKSKKRRVLEPTDLFSKNPWRLPVEIWEHILLLNNSEDIEEVIAGQQSLSWTSKEYFQLVIQVWHEISAKKWPKFYETAMKSLNTANFISFYCRLSIFKEKILEPMPYEEKYFTKACPLCSSEMAQSGSNGEILFCTGDCLTKYGNTIEWKLRPRDILCEGCDTIVQFCAFQCDRCERMFGTCCPASEQRRGIYYEDGRYCKDCAVDCDHCNKYAVFEGELCSRCSLPQCEHCRSVRTCDVELDESDEHDAENKNDEEHDDSVDNEKAEDNQYQ